MHMSKISIIIPVYNAESYLNRCIDSILTQTFIDFDVILIDDGSRDQSLAICTNYSKRDPRIHIICQENCGPSTARNKGIDWAFSESNSEFIVFVDCDDCLHPQFLEYMYYAIKHHTVEIAMSRHAYIAAGQKFSCNGLYHRCQCEEMSAEDLMLSQTSGFNYVWGKIFTKSCFSSLRFPENVTFGEDNLVVFKVIFEYNRVVFVDNILYYYFYTSTGITKSPWTPKSLDVFVGIRAQLNYYAKHGFVKAYEKEIELYVQQYAYQIHRILEDKVNFSVNRPYMRKMQREMNALIRSSNRNFKGQFYLYEALHPVKSKFLKLLSKLKRIIKIFILICCLILC